MLDRMPDLLKRQLLAPYVLGMHFLIQGDYLKLGYGYPAEEVEGRRIRLVRVRVLSEPPTAATEPVDAAPD